MTTAALALALALASQTAQAGTSPEEFTPTCDVTVFVIYEGDNLVVSGASIATLDGTEDIGTTYIDWYSDEGGGGGGDWDWD